jgi:hypothetical protein
VIFRPFLDAACRIANLEIPDDMVCVIAKFSVGSHRNALAALALSQTSRGMRYALDQNDYAFWKELIPANRQDEYRAQYPEWNWKRIALKYCAGMWREEVIAQLQGREVVTHPILLPYNNGAFFGLYDGESKLLGECMKLLEKMKGKTEITASHFTSLSPPGSVLVACCIALTGCAATLSPLCTIV